MLQQTQVATVIPYYERFLRRFPDLKTLARANVDEVLALWSGLGYYARGRNLLKAAQMIYTDFNGEFPDDLESITSLPGIGRSTAAAILSLTWDQRQTILDGNVKRVLARYHMVPDWPGSRVGQQQLWQLAEAHTPHSRCRDYTQAIMDLGATVCRRSQPRCDSCSLADGCQAYQHHSVADFPTARPKKVRPHRHTHMLVITRNGGEILLERRPPTGIWGGLWCLPQLDELPTSLATWGQQRYGVAIEHKQDLAQIKHGFTHFELTISPLLCRVTAASSQIMDNPDQLWYNPLPAESDAAQTPGMATAVKKIIRAYLEPLQP